MGFFTPQSAWGKQMINTPTIRETERKRAEQKELRKKRADAKRAKELKELKKAAAKRKVSKGFWG